jgi:hypothetical protein
MLFSFAFGFDQNLLLSVSIESKINIKKISLALNLLSELFAYILYFVSFKMKPNEYMNMPISFVFLTYVRVQRI